MNGKPSANTNGVARRVWTMIQEHRPLPTDELNKQLAQIAFQHDLDDEAGRSLTMCEISPCIMIALLRELLKYRDKYGLVELPDARWEFMKANPGGE